jgi:porphobilinogen synthase
MNVTELLATAPRTSLVKRPRRLRASPALRDLVRESHVRPSSLVQPLFVVDEGLPRGEISSMPGISRHSVDEAVEESRALARLGIRAVLLFGVPERKDAFATANYDRDGVVQRATRAIKAALPDTVVIADLCNCEYTDHGHCGILDARGDVDNDRTLELLGRTALTYAQAGVDVVAPSDMMDGRVAYLRGALDGAGFTGLPILSYAAKFASAFYGPFREAVDSAPQFGDRRSYQMDPSNAREVLREVALDVEEGADVVMIKPALAYLDLVRAVRERFDVPVACYNVSGEYAMVKAAAQRGWIEEERVVDELLTCFVRAGADIIVTYFAKSFAERRERR